MIFNLNIYENPTTSAIPELMYLSFKELSIIYKYNNILEAWYNNI